MGIISFQGVLLAMKYRKHLAGLMAALTILLLSQVIFAQTQKSATDPIRPRAESVRVFESGEELVYAGEFSRSLLKKVDVADFRFTAKKLPNIENASLKDKTEQPYLLKFTGDVTSKGFFAKLFNLKFRQQIESIVDRATFTIRNTKKIDEQGKRARISETTYSDGKVTWVEKDPNDPSRPQRNVTANYVGQIQDVLSAIYFLRTQPLEVGKTLELTITDSGAVYHVRMKVVEKRVRKTVLGRVETVRVDPELFGPDRLLAGEGQFSIWLTADKRQIPVAARIKIKYGTFDITLRKVNRLTTGAGVVANN
jgi:hypothetical protein